MKSFSRKNRNNTNILKFVLIISLIIVISSAIPASAQSYRDLEGDEIHISTLEAGEYLVEVRGNARFITEDLEITGEEADMNTKKEEVEFRRNVIADAPDFYVSAENLLYMLADERAEFSGDAYVEFQDFTANADRVEYFIAQERALLTGSVEGTRAGDDFSADEVEIDLAAETIDLRGNARIRIFDEDGDLLDEENEDE